MVRRTAFLAFGLALTLLLVAGSAVSAGSGTERRINLSPTAAGARQDISGHARIRKDGARQDFDVEMDARVPNGTVYRVYFTNSAHPGQTFLLGRIVIVAGNGELEVDNDNGRRLPNGVAPVLSVQTVTIKNEAGRTVLRGSF